MPDEHAAAEIAEIVPAERSRLLIVGLLGTEFAALLGLLVWMR